MSKWFIIMEMPVTGTRWAVCLAKKTFGMVPIMGGIVRNATAWSTKEDAEEWLSGFIKENPDAEKMNLQVHQGQISQ